MREELSIVVEWAPFEVRQGVSKKALLEASALLQEEFLERQPGFLRRELLEQQDNQYVDIVWWERAEDAERAMKQAPTNRACQSYFAFMVEVDHTKPCQGVSHFRLVHRYAK